MQNLLRSIPFASSATAKGDFAALSKYGTPIRYALTDTRLATDQIVTGADAEMTLGVSDSLVTPPTPVRPGDYINGPSGTFFFASINAFEIPMIVECNAVITVARPGRGGPVLGPGVHTYDVRTNATDLAMIYQWPASVLKSGRTEAPRADLPGDVPLKGYTVLLPSWPGVTMRPATGSQRTSTWR